uniref:Lipase maturation factor n=1 Tax=Pavo cristatus TaxID=9049 RepID=A0A8C9G1C3_PAVCR
MAPQLDPSNTQPVPNPIAYFMHRSPGWFHQFETLFNHFIELVVPFFIFMGRRMCMVHGVLQILFQVRCFWACFLRSHLLPAHPFGCVWLSLKRALCRAGLRLSWRHLVGMALAPVVSPLLLIVVLLIKPERLDVVFCSITKERTEVILQGTSSPDPNDPAAVWQEFDFKCKPGDLWRRPCFISPYHYRLDWLMWFAAFQTYEQNEWIIHLAGKLLAQEEEALSLMATNPFAGKDPPRWIRGEHFKYKFSQPGGAHAAEGKWWIRKRIGPYFPPVNLQGLRKFYEDRNWPYPVRD